MIIRAVREWLEKEKKGIRKTGILKRKLNGDIGFDSIVGHFNYHI